MKHRFIAVLCCLALFAGVAASAQVINEYVRDHTGSDIDEYVEVFSDDAGFDCTVLSVIEIEGEGTGKGIIDEVFAVPACDVNGFAFIDIDPGTDSLENGTNTLLLVSNFTGAEDDDLDTDDDGILDSTPWMTELDSIAIEDGSNPGDDTFYSAVVLTPDFDGGTFDVGGASRIPDGFDTDSPSDFVRNDFDGAGLPCCDPGTPEDGEALNTPNAPNELVVVAGDQLTVTGSCPGTITIAYTGGTPDGISGIIFSPSEGADPLVGGPCDGTPTGLTNPGLFTTILLDANGEFSIDRTAPSGACGLFLQIVDGATCGISNASALPN